MKESGHFYHFIKEVQMAYTSTSVEWLKEVSLLESSGTLAKLLAKDTNASGVGFTDSLLAEGFIVLMYCSTVSIVSLVLELGLNVGVPFMLRMARLATSRTEFLLKQLRARARHSE